MAPDKVKEVVFKMKHMILYHYPEAKPQRYYSARRSELEPEQVASHLLYCCEKIEEFLKAERVDKVMRWLGFIQGAAWCMDMYTIQEMGQMNMPDRCSICHDEKGYHKMDCPNGQKNKAP